MKLYPWILFSKNLCKWWRRYLEHYIGGHDEHTQTRARFYTHPSATIKSGQRAEKHAINAGRRRGFLDRHNGGVSAVMHSSPPHVAFEPIVVSRVTSGPCAGDWAACARRDKGSGSAGVRQQRSSENQCFSFLKKTKIRWLEDLGLHILPLRRRAGWRPGCSSQESDFTPRAKGKKLPFFDLNFFFNPTPPFF